MLTAQTKRKTNIAEYILYMWQLEDIIRSCNFDIDLIYDSFIYPLEDLDDETKTIIKEWYGDLIHKMEEQGIEDFGHLDELKEIITTLQSLHNKLLNVFQDEKYSTHYQQCKPFLEELKQKSSSSEISDTEIALIGLYGVLMLKIQKKEISKETQEAVDAFTKMIAYLSQKFKEMESGILNMPKTSLN